MTTTLMLIGLGLLLVGLALLGVLVTLIGRDLNKMDRRGRE